jgi:hypothetical protein
MFGEQYRQFLSRGLAFGVFRWLAVWALLFIAAGNAKDGGLASLIIIAIDLAATQIGNVVQFEATRQSRKDWFDRLTNRMFYTLLYEHLHHRPGKPLDIDGMFREAAKMAKNDIGMVDDEDPLTGLSKTTRTWVGAFWSFLWELASSLIYYGSAIVAGRAFF